MFIIIIIVVVAIIITIIIIVIIIIIITTTTIKGFSFLLGIEILFHLVFVAINRSII